MKAARAGADLSWLSRRSSDSSTAGGMERGGTRGGGRLQLQADRWAVSSRVKHEGQTVQLSSCMHSPPAAAGSPLNMGSTHGWLSTQHGKHPPGAEASASTSAGWLTRFWRRHSRRRPVSASRHGSSDRSRLAVKSRLCCGGGMSRSWLGVEPLLGATGRHGVDECKQTGGGQTWSSGSGGTGRLWDLRQFGSTCKLAHNSHRQLLRQARHVSQGGQVRIGEVELSAAVLPCRCRRCLGRLGGQLFRRHGADSSATLRTVPDKVTVHGFYSSG